MSTSASVLDGGSWSENLNYIEGRYIWTRERVTYSSGSPSYSGAIYNSALTSAWINAAAARQIAEDTNQYFWHTETGTDTGAHITEIPMEDFLDDPDNGGGNLLARTNGIAIRDGLREMATFGADGQTFNNEYSRSVLEVGYLPTSTSSSKLNWVAYNGESPFEFVLPWGCNQVNSITYYDSNRAAISGMTVSYTVSGRTITFDATACATMQSSGVAYIAVNYRAVGRFPYFTLGADGVGEKGSYSFREGENTVASGATSHAEGESTVASGINSHAGGYNTIAQGADQTAIGVYNIAEGTPGTRADTDAAFIIGNGTSSARSNAMRVDWGGRAYIARDFYSWSGSLTPTISLGRYVTGGILTSTAGTLQFSVPTGRLFRSGSTVSRFACSMVARATNRNGTGMYIVKASSGGSDAVAIVSDDPSLIYNGANNLVTIPKAAWTVTLQGGTNVLVNIATGRSNFFSGSATNTGYINNQAVSLFLDSIFVTIAPPSA